MLRQTKVAKRVADGSITFCLFSSLSSLWCLFVPVIPTYFYHHQYSAHFCGMHKNIWHFLPQQICWLLLDDNDDGENLIRMWDFDWLSWINKLSLLAKCEKFSRFEYWLNEWVSSSSRKKTEFRKRQRKKSAFIQSEKIQFFFFHFTASLCLFVQQFKWAFWNKEM